MPSASQAGNFLPVSADRSQSVAGRFERQVRATPNHIALRYQSGQYTYQALDRAANQVAQVLIARRGPGEEPVALLAEPGASAIVLLLGVLKAGKFYVPLDPAHPRPRLTSVAADAQPAVLLASSRHRALAQAIAPAGCLVIETDEIRHARCDQPDVAIAGDRLGYVFYTSGSTGRPKGVMQTQRNILRHIDEYASGLGITASDRLTVLHSHAFSASRLDIFTGLLNGAAIHPFSVTDEGLETMARWLEKERISVAHWVPTLFRHFVGSLDDECRFPNLRAIVLGSEPVLPRDVSLFKRRHFADECRLINRFGSTETGNICWAFFGKHHDMSADVVPVGYPVPGVEVVIAGEDGEPVAPGVVGQVCVRSRFLSPGYWNNPGLTRSSFLPEADGACVYLTGDLGRLRPDGALEHLGRQDSQVKVRGFRVELQEIESLLSTHPDVGETVVVPLPRAGEEAELVAFVVPSGGATIDQDAAVSWLSDRLPHYMVPSAVIVLDRLPQTATGKIDRRALAALRDRQRSRDGAPELPSDPTERTLVRMWAEMLGVIAVAATDNFFAIGGNSLLAAQMTLRIQRTFGRELSPAVVFRAPTVRQLAALLRRDRLTAMPSASLVPIQPHGTRTPFFWIHGDWSNAFLAEHLGPDQPLYGVMHQSLDGRPAAYTSVDALARHYVRQIRVVQPDGPYLLGGYSFGGTVAFEMARLLTEEGETVSLLAMLDSLFPGCVEPAPARESRSPRQWMRSLRRAVGSHVDRVSALRLGERIAYVRVRVADRVQRIAGVPLSNAVNGLVCRVCLVMHWRLPMFARSFYLLGIYRNALLEYTPGPWAGRAIYFKSASRHGVHLERWQRLVPCGLEAHEIPGDHTGIVRRDHADAWTGPLRNALDGAPFASGPVSTLSVLPDGRRPGV